jgi:predicted nucleotidyltransferase
MAVETTHLETARKVLSALHLKGVEAVVSGSVAAGNIGPASDIDFLILSCPRALKYKIESIVEDIMKSSHFDVVYREDARPWVLESLQAQAITLKQLQGA